MPADSRSAAVAIVRALLAEDMSALTAAVPDGVPGPGRELIASLASLTVLSARVAARSEGITESEYLDRLAQIWADSHGPASE